MAFRRIEGGSFQLLTCLEALLQSARVKQPAIMYYAESTKKNGLSKSTRAGIIAAVVIVVGIVFLLMGWFLWRNRKLKFTKELAEAQEEVPAWRTKWPMRARFTATSTQSRNGHGEAVELAPPAYDIAQPLPAYEAPRPDQDTFESHELVNMAHGSGMHESVRQNV